MFDQQREFSYRGVSSLSILEKRFSRRYTYGMAELTVLGIGNILMRDEGVGVRLLEAVQAARQWDESVEFIDGGAGGLNLLNVIERARRLVIFDAAEMQLLPGEFRVISPGQVAGDAPEHRISMHDVPVTETLELCRQFLHAPDDVRIFAVQPETVDFGRELSEPIRAAFHKLTFAAAEVVEAALTQISKGGN